MALRPVVVLPGGKRYISPAAEERTGSSCSRAARDTSRRPLRRGREGFVVGSLRVAGRRRAVLSVGPRRRTAGRKGSAYLRGYGEQQGQEGLATHRETERIYIYNQVTGTRTQKRLTPLLL